MYIRKTVDRWDIEIPCGYGWRIVASHYDLENAKLELKEYRTHASRYVRENCRIRKRHERKEE